MVAKEEKKRHQSSCFRVLLHRVVTVVVERIIKKERHHRSSWVGASSLRRDRMTGSTCTGELEEGTGAMILAVDNILHMLELELE
jgi:hypothetical protein